MVETASDNEETDILLPSEVVEGEPVHEQVGVVGRVMGKLIYPLIFAASFSLVVCGPFVDRYFALSPSQLPLPMNATTSIVYQMPAVQMGATSAHVVPEHGLPADYAYDCNCGPFKRGAFGALETHLIGIRYSLIAHNVVSILGYVSMGLLGFGLMIQLVFREFPSTHVFRPQSSISQSWKSSVPVWLLFAGAILSLIRLLLLTSFVQSLSTRIALYTVRTSATLLEWDTFMDQITYPVDTHKFELDVLIALGEWFHKYGASWKISTWAVFLCLAFNIAIVLVVFYSDVRIVRLNEKSMHLKTQIDNLPWHARIRPLWVSISFFLLSVIATKLVGRTVYNAGRATNLLPWGNVSNFTNSIDDVILSRTGEFWFEPAFIVDATSSVWIPLVCAIVFGSVARIEMLSKLIEVLAIGYTIRIFSIGLTIMPASVAVLQVPECYSDRVMSVLDSVKAMEFCNDMMFSGHATLSITPAFIVLFMLIYGPYKDRVAALIGVGSILAISTAIVITGRFHYTSDVVVSVIICALLAIVNAPAWKVLFSYGRREMGIGSKLSMNNVGAILEDTGMRIVAITRGRRIDYYNTDWDIIERKKLQIQHSIEKLQTRLLPLDQ